MRRKLARGGQSPPLSDNEDDEHMNIGNLSTHLNSGQNGLDSTVTPADVGTGGGHGLQANDPYSDTGAATGGHDLVGPRRVSDVSRTDQGEEDRVHKIREDLVESFSPLHDSLSSDGEDGGNTVYDKLSQHRRRVMTVQDSDEEDLERDGTNQLQSCSHATQNGLTATNEDEKGEGGQPNPQASSNRPKSGRKIDSDSEDELVIDHGADENDMDNMHFSQGELDELDDDF